LISGGKGLSVSHVFIEPRMIRYSLQCDADHAFDSWFQSSATFDTLAATGQVACPVCGTAKVSKAPMAPAVVTDRPVTGEAGPNSLTAAPASELEAALAALRRQVEENSDYVGMNFAAEARAIHAGEAPERSIYGEARPEEARKLMEDGLPVAPLPFRPRRKSN
jgi:hypothetical protein